MKRVLQIYRDGHPTERFLNFPLLPGEQGNQQTLEAMQRIVLADRLEPDYRVFVLREIVGRTTGHDAATQVQKIFEYAQRTIGYQRDPFGVERVADIWSTLHSLVNPATLQPEGDCGIKSMFIASCCAILGHKPYFVVIKQKHNQRAFNHVYNAVVVNGELRYYDATPEDAPAGWEAPNVEKRLFEIF